MADKDIKLQGNKMFRTFKTQKELSDYIEQHIPEEKRLLWLGVMFGMNFVISKLTFVGALCTSCYCFIVFVGIVFNRKIHANIELLFFFHCSSFHLILGY